MLPALQPKLRLIAVAAIVVVVLIALILPRGCGRHNEATLSVGHWNLENVFDTQDDPDNSFDDEYLPDAWRRWDEDRYQHKLRNLAQAIAWLQADILCVTEVENRAVLEDLVEVCRREAGVDYPHILHREGPDHRGVDVAILSKYPAESVEWYTPVEAQRDVLVARFSPRDRPITVLANHWKSRYGGREKTEPLRHQQGQAVRKIVNDLLTEDPSAAIIVAGDFNDDFDDPSVATHLLSTGDRDQALAQAGASPVPLYNLHGSLPREKRGTFYYWREDLWNSLDCMSVTPSMLKGADSPAAWRVLESSYEIANRVPLSDETGYPRPFRFRNDKRRGPPGYIFGYSDHFALRVELVPNR